jgi:multiple sugar transport system substrate-binding protein
VTGRPGHADRLRGRVGIRQPGQRQRHGHPANLTPLIKASHINMA